MARQLWLLRHAEAEPHGTRPDFERRLTERGERQARLTGEALACMDVEIATVLSSPKERALRTATLALAAWDERHPDGHGELSVHEPLKGGFDLHQALTLVGALAPSGKLLVVGHEPDFSGVVAGLTGARIDLKKAGLVVVKIDGAEGVANGAVGSRSAAAAGELVLLMRPAELSLIASATLTEI